MKSYKLSFFKVDFDIISSLFFAKRRLLYKLQTIRKNATLPDFAKIGQSYVGRFLEIVSQNKAKALFAAFACNIMMVAMTLIFTRMAQNGFNAYFISENLQLRCFIAVSSFLFLKKYINTYYFDDGPLIKITFLSKVRIVAKNMLDNVIFEVRDLKKKELFVFLWGIVGIRVFATPIYICSTLLNSPVVSEILNKAGILFFSTLLSRIFN